MDQWIPRKTQIVVVEMYAVIKALLVFDDLIAASRVVFLIDSEAVEGALIKGYSGRSDICELTGLFWDLIRKLQIEAYIERAPTDANLSDGPSRGKGREARQGGWLRRSAAELTATRTGLGVAHFELFSGSS